MDDVSAVVVHIGHCSSYAGFAGFDSPQLMMDSQRHLHNLAPTNVVSNDSILDFDRYSSILTHSLSTLYSSNDYPLLLSDYSLSTTSQRESLIQFAFESLNLPAFYLAKIPVLTAYTSVTLSFAAGKSSALIIDSGAEFTSVVPVHEGFVLKKGAFSLFTAIQKSKIAGNALSDFSKRLLESNGIPVIPHYLVKSRIPVDPGKVPSGNIYTDINKSIHDYSVNVRLLIPRKYCMNSKKQFSKFQSLRFVKSLTSYSSALVNRPPKSFEFPNGYNNSFGLERFRIPELIFDPSMDPQSDPANTSLNSMIMQSLNLVDADIRSLLFGNIVVTGGTSLIPGFAERINNSLHHAVGMKHRVHSSAFSSERRFGPWIGGSIMASCASFHQMWISREEYQEKGVSVEKRIP